MCIGAIYQSIVGGYLYNTVLQIKFLICDSNKKVIDTVLHPSKSKIITEKALEQAILKQSIRKRLRERRRFIKEEDE